ncbi:MAG TPA: hypothetical protein VJH96_04660 [Patescibacteria group bacterium]|nr:hypothetical protein [Patescibacteria group bacterium]
MENSQEHSLNPGVIHSREKRGVVNVDQETGIKDFSLKVLKEAPPLSLLDFCEKFSRGRKGYFSGKTGDATDQLQHEMNSILIRRDLAQREKEDMLFGLLKNQPQPMACAFIEVVLSDFQDDPVQIGKKPWTINDLAYFMVHRSLRESRGDYELIMTEGSAMQRILVYAFLYESPENISRTIDELSRMTHFFGGFVYAKDTQKYVRQLDGLLFRTVVGAASCALGLKRAEKNINRTGTRVSPAPIDLWDFQYGIDGIVWNVERNTIAGFLASRSDKISIQQNQEDREQQAIVEQGEFFSSRLHTFPAFSSFGKLKKGEEVGAGLKRQRDFERFLAGSSIFATQSKKLLDPDAQLFFWMSHFPKSVAAFNNNALTPSQFARQTAEVLQKT